MKCRPTASIVCDTISHLVEASTIFPPIGTHFISDAVVLHQPHALAQVAPSVPFSHPLDLMLAGHTKSVWCTTFSPNGNHIVSGSGDHSIIVWDAKSGSPALGPLEGHTKGWNVLLSPPIAAKLSQVLGIKIF
jgi:WD40 repeat protein